VYRDLGKTHCEDRCLEERRFICRSASYDWKKRECRLSTEDRFTQPRGFIATPDSDYLENQCAPRKTNPISDTSCIEQPTNLNRYCLWLTESRQCSYVNVQREKYLIYVDKAEPTQSDVNCQRACDKEREFNCRSFSFLTPVSAFPHRYSNMFSLNMLTLV